MIKIQSHDNEIKIIEATTESEYIYSNFFLSYYDSLLLENQFNTNNTFVVGDLHGNYLKLLSSLQHLCFLIPANKNSNSFLAGFQDLSLYLKKYMKDYNWKKFRSNVFDFLNFAYIINPKIVSKKIIFVGDTLCDRGISDFLTLVVFEWMKEKGIQFDVLLGNHELMLFFGRIFVEEDEFENQDVISNLIDFSQSWLFDQSEKNAYFYSFKLLKIPPEHTHGPLKAYYSFYKKIKLFEVCFTKNKLTPILLTHTPITKEHFSNVIHSLYCAPHFDSDPARQKSSLKPKCVSSPYNDIHFLPFFDITLSKNEVKNFHSRFQDILIKDLTNPITLCCNDFWARIENFCSTRATQDGSNYTLPFFFDDEPGFHIFGHEAGSRSLFDNYSERLGNKRFCLDSTAGMALDREKSLYYSGNAYYACFNT